MSDDVEPVTDPAPIGSDQPDAEPGAEPGIRPGRRSGPAPSRRSTPAPPDRGVARPARAGRARPRARRRARPGADAASRGSCRAASRGAGRRTAQRPGIRSLRPGHSDCWPTAAGSSRAAVGGVFGRWHEIVGARAWRRTPRRRRSTTASCSCVADSTAWATQVRLLARDAGRPAERGARRRHGDSGSKVRGPAERPPGASGGCGSPGPRPAATHTAELEPPSADSAARHGAATPIPRRGPCPEMVIDARQSAV